MLVLLYHPSVNIIYISLYIYNYIRNRVYAPGIGEAGQASKVG